MSWVPKLTMGPRGCAYYGKWVGWPCFLEVEGLYTEGKAWWKRCSGVLTTAANLGLQLCQGLHTVCTVDFQ